MSQTREEIADKLDAARPRHGSSMVYQELLLELILDVLVDIRDANAYPLPEKMWDGGEIIERTD